MNVTVPGPENCASMSLCWVEGNDTITLKNVSQTYNVQKCKNECDLSYIKNDFLAVLTQIIYFHLHTVCTVFYRFNFYYTYQI